MILDRALAADDRRLLDILKMTLAGGADAIQLREKGSPLDKKAMALARQIGRACRDAGVPFIVNDRCELALASGADGLHIGQGDIALKDARRLMGHSKLIGVSCGSVKEALIAKAGGADYISVGPVFKTPFKEDKRPVGIRLVKKVKRLGLPVVAIGGINLDNVTKLVEKGIRAIAVIRAVSSARDPRARTRALREALT